MLKEIHTELRFLIFDVLPYRIIITQDVWANPTVEDSICLYSIHDEPQPVVQVNPEGAATNFQYCVDGRSQELADVPGYSRSAMRGSKDIARP